MLWNLLRNAVRYASPEASSVRIELRSLARQVELNIIDNGRGVAPEHQAQLFEPFVTTKWDGLGIGLAIAQTIVTAHSGRLEYREGADGGAVFAFSLAAAE